MNIKYQIALVAFCICTVVAIGVTGCQSDDKTKTLTETDVRRILEIELAAERTKAAVFEDLDKSITFVEIKTNVLPVRKWVEAEVTVVSNVMLRSFTKTNGARFHTDVVLSQVVLDKTNVVTPLPNQ